MGDIIYCKDAKRLRNINVVCGKDCPILKEGCPRLTLEDATDKAVDKAIEQMIEIVKELKKGGNK